MVLLMVMIVIPTMGWFILGHLKYPMMARTMTALETGTSMMSTEAEAAVYAALRQRGIAVLSVGHRESLRPLHDQVLVLEPDTIVS